MKYSLFFLLFFFLAGTDFLSQSVQLVIPVTEQSVLDEMYSLPAPERLNVSLPTSPPVCASISIVDDDILELQQTREFAVSLSDPDPAIFFVEPLTAVVTVIDDDGVTVVVDEASISVSVTEGESVRVCARMLGTADFPIQASFRPRPIADSAIAGVDFDGSEQLLEFPALSTELQCMEVRSLDDTIVERAEQFEVQLNVEHPDTRVALGNSSTVTITIIDNDCESSMACDCHVTVL